MSDFAYGMPSGLLQHKSNYECVSKTPLEATLRVSREGMWQQRLDAKEERPKGTIQSKQR